MKLYFAYGSNLCKKQIKARCPKSKYLEKHYFDDHKLCFCWNGLSTNPNGVANIIKETGSKVPGVIFEISDDDEIVLNRREGFNLTPKVYDKKNFKYKDQNVLYYVLNRKCDPRKPKESYWRDKIYQGYKDHQLDTKYLKEALNYFDIKLIGE
jgi:hypothetical protein